MAETKKKRGKVRKFFLRFLIVVFALLLVVGIIQHKWIFAFIRSSQGRSALKKGSEGLTHTERSLTSEQMLTDFDYLFKNACTDSLVKAQSEKYLGIDYDEVYRTYKARIENCKDEFEFFSVMVSLMAKLPGAHNSFIAPTNNLEIRLNFPLSYQLGDDNVIETNYDYWVQFEDRMWSYTQKSACAVYYGGDYVFRDFDRGFGQIDDILDGRLISLNGEPVQTAVKKLDTIHHWDYDAQYDCVRIENIYFNDSIGEKYDAEIEMPDGSIIHKTLYNSAEFNAAALYRIRYYPDHNTQSNIGGTTVSSEETSQRTYTINTDSSRKLVYVKAPSCLNEEKEPVFLDITAAINEVDAENIIIDVQDNPGGNCDFVIQGLCRAIFDKEVGLLNYFRYPKTDIAQLYFDNDGYVTGVSYEDNGEYLRFSGDYRIKGEAKKKYNIYVLINDGTVSSGDIFAYITSQEDNVTLLGTNTQGEGISGNPLNYYLPESKFAFAFTMCISETYPEDNVVGTVPDVYCPTTWEDYIKTISLRNDPISKDKSRLLEYRQQFDRPLIEALKLIDSNNR